MRARVARRRARVVGTALAGTLALALVPFAASPAPASDGTPIMGPPVLSASQLVAFYESKGRTPDLSVSISTLAQYFIEEGKAEGVRGDIAFAQAIHETGWFEYGGDVPAEHNNYAGLGATGGVPGNKFATARQGVRAQIHHLRAYADPAMAAYVDYPDPDPKLLAKPPVKPENEPRARFLSFDSSRYGSAKTWEALTGRWAADPEYDKRVLGTWTSMLEHAKHLKGAYALTGDWNGNGRATPGWFHDGWVYLTNRLDSPSPDVVFRYGRKGDIPVVGDWNGNGTDTIGIIRGGQWHLRNSNTGGPGQIVFWYGRIRDGDYPLAGDWNGNGIDTPGIVRDGQWHLRNSNTGGPGQIVFWYGRVRHGDVPVVGDWDGNGIDTPGIIREGEWHLRDVHAGGDADRVFHYGWATDLPVVGDWNRNGITTPGVVRGTTWLLRNANTGGGASHSVHFDAR